MILFICFLDLSSSISVNFIPSTKSPPSARSEAFMDYLQARSSLIIFGGWNSEIFFNDLWEFSLVSSTWSVVLSSSLETPRNPYTEPRTGFGGFSSKTEAKFYIFGGLTTLGPENDFWEFDFKSMKWERLKTFSTPSPRYLFGFTTYSVLDFVFFVIQAGSTFAGEVNEMYQLNMTSLRWEALPGNGEAPEPSQGPILIYHEEQILQAAGVLEDLKPCLPYLYSYSLSSLQWSVISDRNSFYTCLELTQGFIYQNEFFILFGWEYEQNVDSRYVYKISLVKSDKKWEKIQVWPELAGDAFSVKIVGNFAYFFGGFNLALNSHTNQLHKVQLESQVNHQINQNFLLPKPRTLHSMVVLNSKLYVFGGIDSDVLFNDLWAFDILKSLWVQIAAKGDVPSPRHSHAANAEGDIFIIWGGESVNGLKDDMFIFNSITGFWTQLISLSLKPSPAKGSCLVLKNFKVYLYGGQRDSDSSDELWFYDIGTNKFEYISSSHVKVSFCYCWIDSNLFYFSLGVDQADGPSTQIIYYNLLNGTWNSFHKHTLASSDFSQSSQLFIGNRLISIGGQAWMQIPSKKISILAPGNKFSVLDYELNFHSYASASGYFNKSLYIFGGGSISGKTFLPKYGSNLLAEIRIDQLCLGSDCKALCSSGTYWNGKTCVVCGTGSYAEGMGKEKCTECEPGTYNNKTASTILYQCLPCNEGTYNNASASASCKSCPVGKFCPIRCSKPLENLTSEQNASFQPSLYQQPDLSRTLLIYRISVSAPLILALIICLSIKRLRNKLQKLDVFSQKHQNYENDYVVKKKTLIGAFFTVLFVISALLLTCTTVLSYLKANIHETKGQVPLVVLDSDVSSFISEEISLKLSLTSYGGKCESNSKCNPLISFSTSNIFCSETSQSCKLVNIDTCSITLTCKSGEIKTSSKIFFSFKESLSYSSQIKVNLTSSSSIPGQVSSMSSVISSESGSVFIGSVASKFHFLATPSLFKSESSQWNTEETGYHISEKSSPDAGSQFTPEELPGVSYLNVEVNIETSPNALLTHRLLKQDFVIFVGAFLGTASGLFGIAGFAMSFFEIQVDKIMMKRRLNAISEQGKESDAVVRIPKNLESTKIETWGK